MTNRFTLMIFCSLFLLVNLAVAQTPTNGFTDKKVEAFKSVKKTTYKGEVAEKNLTSPGPNALPVGAVVLWGGPGDPNGEFAGGLNDWTTAGEGNNNSDAFWGWDAQGDAATGAYWGTLPAIVSPSASNGAAVFNSDFLDNNGIQGNFGNGPSPSPHYSELISPTIDLTGQSNVALSFFSYYRNFQSSVYVSYSNNDGASWSDLIQLHGDVPVNERTINGEEMLVYFPGSGNTDKFRFKFVWDGDYYFWIVDDVAIIEQPRNDIRLESFFYTPASYGQPKGHIDSDEFFFQMNLSNLGSEAQTNVQLTAKILNSSNAVIYEDMYVIDELAAGVTDSSFQFDNTYFPAGLAIGNYRIEYSITADSTDQWGPDNMDETKFRVTNNVFQAETGNSDFAGGNAVAGLPQWEIGNVYHTGADFMGETFVATSITFAPFDFSDAGSLNGKDVLVALVEIPEGVDVEDGKDFLEDNNLIKVGLSAFTFTNQANGATLTVDLDDFEGNGDPIILKEDTDYYALVSYPDSTGNVFNSEIDYGEGRSSFLAYNGSWFGGFSNSTDVPLVRLNIGILNAADDNPLPESTLGVYPNPVADQLTANIDLEVMTKAKITIADVTGKVMATRDFDNIGTQTVQFNTSNYANGVYLIRLSTDEGTRTVKFIVQK